MIIYDIDYIQFMLMFRSAVRTSDIRVCKVRGDGGRGADGGTLGTPRHCCYITTPAPRTALVSHRPVLRTRPRASCGYFTRYNRIFLRALKYF